MQQHLAPSGGGGGVRGRGNKNDERRRERRRIGPSSIYRAGYRRRSARFNHGVKQGGGEEGRREEGWCKEYGGEKGTKGRKRAKGEREQIARVLHEARRSRHERGGGEPALSLAAINESSQFYPVRYCFAILRGASCPLNGSAIRKRTSHLNAEIIDHRTTHVTASSGASSAKRNGTLPL